MTAPSKECQQQRIRQRKLQTCKHYKGYRLDEDHTKMCGHSINVRELVGGEDPGWLKRIPCFEFNNAGCICEKYEPHTLEEIIQEEQEWEAYFAKILPFTQKLKASIEPGQTGEDVCPLCEKRVQYARSSSNGHLHAVCETEGCFKVME